MLLGVLAEEEDIDHSPETLEVARANNLLEASITVFLVLVLVVLITLLYMRPQSL